MTSPKTSVARNYDSSRRRETAAGTRADVLAAAARLFVERGWAGTSMREIARAARVSVETVYAAVGPKGEVLRAVLDVAVVGDDESTPLRERPEFLIGLGTGSLEQRARAAADLLGVIMPRTAPLCRALQHGAAADPALADLLDTTLANQRVAAHTAAALLTEREPTALEVGTVHALFTESVYLLLTESSGWDNETYRAWVVETLVRQFTPSPHPTRKDSR